MNKRKVGKTLKRILSAVMALVLVASVMVTLTVLVNADYKSLQYIEEIKEEKINSATLYKIFELVPDASETTMGYYTGTGIPTKSFINSAISNYATSADREKYINDYIYAKLSDVIGPVGSSEDDYPVTKLTSEGYKEYFPWDSDIPTEKDDDGVERVTLPYIETGSKEQVEIDNKFRAPKDGEGADYQSVGIYELPEYFYLSQWANNAYSKKSLTNGLNIITDNNSYIKLENDQTLLKSFSNLTEGPHTGYSTSTITSLNFDKYYSMAVTPGETYSFSFNFSTEKPEGISNGTDGQFTLYTYSKDGKLTSGKTDWSVKYTPSKTVTQNDTRTTSGTISDSYALRARGVDTGLYDEFPGYYEYTFTVPENVYYLQVSFGTWYQGISYDAQGSVSFSNIHLRSLTKPDMVQKITTFDAAVDYINSDTADDYYYAVNYTPLKSIDDFDTTAIVYEQMWDNNGEQYYYFIDNETNDDGTVTQKITLSTIKEHGDTGVQIPAYQVFLDKNEITGDSEYSQAKLDKGGYGKLTINEDADVVVTEQWDEQHFYHAVPVYDTYDGDNYLAFMRANEDTTGYYSGTKSYFVTKEITYYYVGSGGNSVYDRSLTSNGTVKTFTDTFFYDTGISSNQWFAKKVFDCSGDDLSFDGWVESYSPEDVKNNENQLLISLYATDMIVISGGAKLFNEKFVDGQDITSGIKDAILELAGSDYNIPIVVDANVLNMVSKDTELYSLVNTLINRTTDSEVSISKGGVSQNIYVFSSSDVGGTSIATSKFNTSISNGLKSDGSYAVNSPYYDVYSEIEDENFYRDLSSYTYESTKLPEVVSEATCMRCIINYPGRRVKNLKKEIRVLDIEPYISVDHRTAVITDSVNAYGSGEKGIKYSKATCLKAYEVMGWLPENTEFTVNGQKYTASLLKTKDKEELAAQFIKITTMSIAELVGHNESLIGNYDLIYFGDSLDNFQDGRVFSGVKYNKYNDTEMDGLLYSGMGDTYVIGNNGSFIAGDTLLGLNREDYTAPLSDLGISGFDNIRYINSSETSTVRASGNDITDTVEKKLEAFAAAGLPVVIANNLTSSAEGTGLDGGWYDDEGNLHISFSVTLETKTQFRRYNSDNGNQYFTYFLATFNGNLPAGVSVMFNWYAVAKDDMDTSTGKPKSGKQAVPIGSVTAKTGFLGKNTTSEEPIHAYSIQNDKDKDSYTFYSTIGDIDQNFDYYDWKYGKNSTDAITGMTIPTNDSVKIDGNSVQYQKLDTYYYCVADLIAVNTEDNPVLNLYNNTHWQSNIVQAVAKKDEKLKINVASSKGGSTTVTITPNPYYIDGISDNFSFWWKDIAYAKKFLGTWKWREIDDDYDHRIDHEDLWQATQMKTITTYEENTDKITSTVESPVIVNRSDNGHGVNVVSERDGDKVTVKGYDTSDNNFKNNPIQVFESSGSWDYKKDSDGNLLKDNEGFYIQNNPGYLKMTINCAHSTNGNVRAYVELRIKAINYVKNNSGSNFPSGVEISLTDTNQMGDDFNYGQSRICSDYPGKGETDDVEDLNLKCEGSTYEMPYETLILKDAGITVTNEDIVDKGQLSYINRITVDDTTKIYKFLSSVYDTVTNIDGTYVTRSDGAELKKNNNVFNETEFIHAKDTSDIKQNLCKYLCKEYTPELRMINNSVLSYPKVLSGSTISGEFAIYSDADSSDKDQYGVKFYIDKDHDAKFTPETEEVDCDVFDSLNGNKITKGNYLYSSTTDNKQVHEYKFEKALSDDYMGLVSWKLEIYKVNNDKITDSYEGCSYLKSSKRKEINALQVLPADWWSAPDTSATSYKGVWKHITTQSYGDENGKEKTVGSGEYTGNLPVGYVGNNAELKNAYETERTNEVLGNAYYGSVFLGDNGNTKIVEKTEDGQYKVVYADAFFSLTQGEDSLIKRTVYYESTGSDDDDYRTHVVFWIRPQGEMTPEKDEHGNIKTDHKGNTIYEYVDCDYKVDVALTDIYELNHKYAEEVTDKNIPQDKEFLDKYHMLILGFGDSYGKSALQTSILRVFNKNLLGNATYGFNINAALAIKKFIEKDKKPVLFCHDTTNTTNDYLSYFAQTGLGKATEKLQKWAVKIEELWEKAKSWFTGKDSDWKDSDGNDFDAYMQDSKVKDGYYNNILLRDSLNLDRYGITYSIRQTIGENNIKEGMANSTWASGYKYNGIPYYQKDTKTSVEVMKAKNFSIVYPSRSTGYYTFSEKNGKNTVMLTTYHTKTEKGAGNEVPYVVYKNGEPVIESYKEIDKNKIIETEDEYGNLKLDVTYNYKPLTDDDEGNASKVDYDKSAQGFTTWAIVRYGDKTEKSKDQKLPAGMISANTDGHVITTNKIQQVNKGQITTYPYDINTAEFGGTVGNTDESSESYGKITIKATHEQVYQVNANGDETTVWYTLAGADDELNEDGKVQNLYYDDYDAVSKDVFNSYYIFSSGNVTYTGAGHSNIFSEEEAKLFINTLVASYRLPGENPQIDFGDKKGNRTNNLLITADESETSGVTSLEVNDKDCIASIEIDDPNTTREALKVVFYGETENFDEKIVLYTSEDCSGEAVAHDKVKSGVTYYFKLPDEVKKALVSYGTEKSTDSETTESVGSYEIRANVISTVKVEGVDTDYSGDSYLTIRRVGLYNLS